MDSRAFFKSAVVHKWQYVCPVQAVAKIRKMQQTCRDAGYLECVLEHAEVSKIAREFSDMHNAPELADLDAFVHHVERLKEEKPEDTQEE